MSEYTVKKSSIRKSSRGKVKGWEYQIESPEGVVTTCFHGGEYTREQIAFIAHKAADRLSKMYGKKKGRLGPKGRTEAQTATFQPIKVAENAIA